MSENLVLIRESGGDEGGAEYDLCAEGGESCQSGQGRKMMKSAEKKIKIMRNALESARDWFKSFRYNVFGIAIEDDVSDPQEILKEIEYALQEASEADKKEK